MSINRLMRGSGLAVALTIACCAGPAWPDSISIDGVARSYTLQRSGDKPAPLVIVLHGNTQTGADVAARSSWPDVASN